MWPFSSKKKREGEVNQNCIFVRIRPGYYKSEKEMNKDLMKVFPFLVKKDMKDIKKVLEGSGNSHRFRMFTPGKASIKHRPSPGIISEVLYGNLKYNCECQHFLSICYGCHTALFENNPGYTLQLFGRGADAIPPSYRKGRHIHGYDDLLPTTDEDIKFFKRVSKESGEWDEDDDNDEEFD